MLRAFDFLFLHNGMDGAPHKHRDFEPDTDSTWPWGRVKFSIHHPHFQKVPSQPCCGSWSPWHFGGQGSEGPGWNPPAHRGRKQPHLGTALKPCERTDTSAVEGEEEPGLRRSHPSIIKRCFQRPNGPPGVETNLAAFQRKSEQIRQERP